MIDAALEAVLRRDRALIVLSLTALTLAAWTYVFWLVDSMSMGGMEMPGMRMDANPLGAAMIPALQPWSATEFVLMFIMWAIMMVGMMTPSAAPMILLYARVARQAAARRQPMAATSWFAAGYLLAWAAFSIIATAAQWALERAALLSPMMAGTSMTLGGAILIAAGLYQWTPLKDACLSQCQAPLLFIQRHGGFRRDARGSLLLGAQHGAYCVGCCWALMTLLFVGGVMNLLWVAGIAAFVLLEKIVPVGPSFSRVTGVGLVGGGIWLIAA